MGGIQLKSVKNLSRLFRSQNRTSEFLIDLLFENPG
ncbi:MAG: hypothetical protein JWR12_1154 [Mucilaginibacter sp.]|nr:hypothetical protein [Mucilaginibacter sp.]